MRASVISSFTPIEGDEESYEIDNSLPNPQKEIITGYSDATSPERDDVLPGSSTNKQGMDKRKEKITKKD